MKIVYVSNSIIPSRTANSIHVMKMSQAFALNGHEVILLVANRKKECEQDIDNIYKYYGVKQNFEVRRLKCLDKKFIRQITYSLEILKELKKLNPDIVYGRYLYGCFLASFKYKTYFESHAPMDTLFKEILFRVMHQQDKFQRTIVISKALKNIIIKKYNINKDKLFIAHDGADEVKDNSKIELRGDKNQLNIGYVGHLYKGRGIEIIIQLSKYFQNINFHIVGGTKKDIKYWSEVIKRDNIKNFFLYGFVSPQETVKFRNSFDIVLAPYTNSVSVSGNSGDTSTFMSPLKIFEYMAHKKAIVVSDLPVLREVLNNTNSLLVEVHSINAWVEAINRLLDKNFREEIASNAYIDFINYYRWSDRTKKVINTY
jgi:glycosyltransferase involved in cell wall biosynthesis